MNHCGLNDRVLERVGRTLKGFPHLIFLPQYLQNQQTKDAYGESKHFYQSDERFCFSLNDVISWEVIEEIQAVYCGKSSHTYHVSYLDNAAWVWILLNYLYLLSHHPEEDADSLFAIVGISVKKVNVLAMAAALSFLSDKGWKRVKRCYNNPNMSFLNEIENPIYRLDKIHQVYSKTTKKRSHKSCQLMLYCASCMVAVNQFDYNSKDFRLFCYLMGTTEPSGDKDITYQRFDLLGFPLSALFDTTPERKVVKDILSGCFDDLCTDAALLDSGYFDMLPQEVKDGLGKWHTNYFPDIPYKELPILGLFNGKKDFDVKQEKNIDDLCTFHETIQKQRNSYNLFQAVHQHLEGNPHPLKELSQFAYPTYISHICACEALLLIYTYADKLGKKMCEWIALKFIPPKRLFNTEFHRSLPAFVLMSSNEWATRLYPQARFYHQSPVLKFAHVNGLLVSGEDSSLSNQSFVSFNHLSPTSNYQIFSKKPINTNKNVILNPQSNCNNDPVWFSLRNHPLLSQLTRVLSAFPLLSHEFGHYCFHILKQIYRVKQSSDCTYLFSRKVLREFYLVNRLIDTKGKGKYHLLWDIPSVVTTIKGYHMSARAIALNIRILWDTLHAPEQTINLNDYCYPDVISCDLEVLEISAEFFADLDELFHVQKESILPLIPYLLEATSKKHDLRYILTQGKNSLSLGIPKEISSEIIPYFHEELRYNKWALFIIYFCLPLYRQYWLEQM